MQVIAEFLTAIVVWIAAAVLAQFGVDVELDRHRPPQVERVIERRASADALAASAACPEARKLVRKEAVASI